MPSVTSAGDTTTVEWNWDAVHTLTQVSVGEAAMVSGPTASMRLQIETPGGGWTTVSQSRAAVGDGKGDAPYLLASLPAGTAATAMRLIGTGTSAGNLITVGDAHALASDRNS